MTPNTATPLTDAIAHRIDLVPEGYPEKTYKALCEVCAHARSLERHITELRAYAEEARNALEYAQKNLQFWMEHARADGDTILGVRMPNAALYTLQTLRKIKPILSRPLPTLEQTKP